VDHLSIPTNLDPERLKAEHRQKESVLRPRKITRRFVHSKNVAGDWNVVRVNP
jgi:hypothetical protein